VSKAKPELRCRDCGAPNDPGGRECWLCQRRDWRSRGTVVPVVGDASRGESRRSTWDQVSKVETAFLLGCLSAAGVLFAIVIVPLLAIISVVISVFQACSAWNRPH
jgi:hypothetical protein